MQAPSKARGRFVTFVILAVWMLIVAAVIGYARMFQHVVETTDRVEAVNIKPKEIIVQPSPVIIKQTGAEVKKVLLKQQEEVKHDLNRRTDAVAERQEMILQKVNHIAAQQDRMEKNMRRHITPKGGE